jgi:protein gp37
VGDKTKIEWTDSSWNPVTGCTPISPACDHCYAKAISNRFGDSFTVTLHPDRLDVPRHWKKGRKIFLCSMGDLFHKDVPDEFINQVFSVMADCPQHTFQVLTKRPERMREYLADKYPLPNVWVGTTIENQEQLEKRLPHLLNTRAELRFVSCEPLLSPLVFCPHCAAGNSPIMLPEGIKAHETPDGYCDCTLQGLGWIITGGENGPHSRKMEPDWVRGILQQARLNGIPFFFKGWVQSISNSFSF